MTGPAPALGLAALCGLALGSYAVTAAVRFARAEPSTFGRSHCDGCGRTLRFSQTIPVLSYVRAQGRCDACRTAIDPIHLVGELSGLLVLLMAFLASDLIRSPLLAALGLVLVAAAVIDWKVGRLPNVLTAAVAVLALMLAASKSIAAVEIGLGAATISLGVLLVLRWVMGRTGRDPGLGLGDVKLICALALWLGLATPWMVVGAAMAGLLVMNFVRPPDGRMAFGPALALAGWMVGIGGEWGLWPTIA